MHALVSSPRFLCLLLVSERDVIASIVTTHTYLIIGQQSNVDLDEALETLLVQLSILFHG